MSASGRRRVAYLSYAPKFFRIITDPLAHTLLIPSEFMKMFGKNLHNPVLLKVPSGSLSEVEVIQSNGDTLLGKGWQEFKECYSIGFGYFLVFEYDGYFQFYVNIFDTSAAEINYPSGAAFGGEDNGKRSDRTCNRRKGKALNVEDSDTESDVSIKLLGNPPARQQNTGKRKHCDDPDYHSFCSITDPKSIYEEYRSGRRNSQRVVSRKTSVAYRKALAFTSAHTLRNPFYICLMHPSYVSSGFSLSLPLSFAKEKFPSNSTSDLTIRLKNGNAWRVSRHVGKRQVYIAAGWKEFVVENRVKVGDACLFQVAKNSVWNVDIFRG